MRALARLTFVEARLLSRDTGLLAFGLVFPALLLYVLGAFMPGFRDVDPELGGLRLIDVYTPIVLVLVFAMTGVSSIPQFLATYRHQGVLRRLRTTPVGPGRLLAAQLLAHLGLTLVASAALVAVARLVFDVPMEGGWIGFVVGLVLAAASLFSIGLVIGAVAPSPTSAPVIGTFTWLGLMVLAGLWAPREVMGDTMRTVSDLSPAGAAVDAISDAWFASGPAASSLAVMAGFALVAGLTAAVTFRWE